jgi:hypothetical protein
VQHTDQSDKGVIVSTVFLHESGEHMETGSIFVPAAQNSPQAFGSALTYARRYSLMTACGIAPEDDDGNAASKPTPARKPDVKAEPDVDYWTTKFGAQLCKKKPKSAQHLVQALNEIAPQLGGELPKKHRSAYTVTANGQRARKRMVTIGAHIAAHKTTATHNATLFGTFSGQMESGVRNERIHGTNQPKNQNLQIDQRR